MFRIIGVFHQQPGHLCLSHFIQIYLYLFHIYWSKIHAKSGITAIKSKSSKVSNASQRLRWGRATSHSFIPYRFFARVEREKNSLGSFRANKSTSDLCKIVFWLILCNVCLFTKFLSFGVTRWTFGSQLVAVFKISVNNLKTKTNHF